MVNKFDKGVAKDWSWQTAQLKVPTLDYEMLNSIAATKQAEFDNIASLNALVPNALTFTPDDVEKQNTYRSWVNEGTKSVTDAYMQSPSKGAAAYRDFKSKVQKAWQPGGEADMLNKRYSSYFESKKAIDEYYKDETNPAFKQYAYDQLQKQAMLGTGYNPETGDYQSIITPELFKNPNLRKTILETIKEIDESGDTQFLGPDKQHWIQKIQSTGKSEEKIKLATEALMSQPEFANELKVEQWFQGRNGMGKGIADNYIAKQEVQHKTLVEQIKQAAAGKGTKDFQELLIEQGYDLEPTGKVDDKTKAALKDFEEKQRKIIDNNKTNPDLEQVAIKKSIKDSYVNYALGFANKKVTKDLIHDKTWEIQMKAQSDRERTSALLQLNDRLAPIVDPDILTTPQPAINLTSTFDLLRDTKKNKEAFENTASKLLTQNPNSIFNGWTLSNVSEAQRLYNEVPTTANGKPLSEADRQKIFASKLAENSSFKFTGEQITNLFNGMKTDTGVNSTFEQLAAMDHSTKMLEEQNKQISQIYTSTPEGKKAISTLRASVTDPSLKNLSDEQLASEALVNPQKFELKYQSGSNPNSQVAFRVGENPAKRYRSTMESDSKKLQSQGVDFKTDNAWGIHAGSDDKFLRPVYDNINASLNSQIENTFASEGMAGLVLRDLKGEITDGKPVFKDGYVFTDADGKAKYRAVGMVPKKDGEAGKMVSTTIELNSGNPIGMQLERALRKELAQNAATQNWANVESVSKVLASFDGKNMVTSRQEQEAPLTGVQPEPLNIKDADGNFTTTEKLGIKTRKIGTKTWGGVQYHTYVGQTLSGEKVFFNTADVVDKSGNPTGKRVVLPLRNGKQYTKNVAEINTQNMADEIISQTPVERDVKKIPNGVVHAITNFQ